MEEAILRQLRERIEQIGSTDLVVGIMGGGTEMSGAMSGAAMVEKALTDLSAPARAVIVQSAAPNGNSSATNPSGPSEGSKDSPVVVLPGLASSSETGAGAPSMSEAYRSVFAVGSKLEARACCMIVSNLETVTPRWIYLLSEPVLEMGFDVVTPCYAHHTFEGLLNAAVISPLHRALYGQQIQNPMGPDLGFSQRALQRVYAKPGVKSFDHPLVSLTPAAIGGGFKICQAHVGKRLYPPTDWSNVSSLLVQILDPLFADVERNAAIWQRIRGSRPVPAFGEPAPDEAGAETPDLNRMIESFQLGIRDLREIWALVLPPSTLLHLTRLARLPQEQFHIPDELWARVIFDFALGHHLRIMSRDHLLRAMTPLYLGWVASYALELRTARANTNESPIDRLGAAFETAKPYFVSRWRWPDRFNP